MPDSLVTRPLGRISEPSHSTAPQGAMLRADNCVLRAEGELSPVPDPLPFGDLGAFQPVAMSDQYDNGSESAQLLVGVVDGSVRARSSQAMGVNLPYQGTDGVVDQQLDLYQHSGGAVDWDYTTYPFHITRGNLYTCDKRSVYKWQNTDATELTPVRDAPSRMDYLVIGGGTGFLPTANHVGYCMVVVFEDDNGVIRRSMPSRTSNAFNSSGSDTNIGVFLYIPEWVRTDATLLQVEVYRTRTFGSSIALPNEFYLVAALTYAEYAALGGYYTDDAEDADLGASLYTSSSQGGALAANVTPPEHLYHATFRGHEFWGNVAEKELFPPLQHTGTDADLSIAFTGDTTSGVALIQNVATAGLAAGMWIEGGTAPDGAYITAVTDLGGGVYNLAVSYTPGATASGVSFTAYPGIVVKTPTGETFRARMVPQYPRIENIDGVPFENQGIDVVSMSGVGRTLPSPYDFDATLSHVLRTARSGPSQMWINFPDQFEGTDWADLGATDGDPAYGTGTDALPALHRRRIYWSKLQEPEHTTLVNFVDVDTEAQIVGLGALTDALLILTARGVYRLTGSNGNWRIDPIDTSVDLIGGRASQVMGNALYTLGDRGMLRIGSAGVENLSDGVVGDWFMEPSKLLPDYSRLQGVRTYMLAFDGYHPLFLLGAADASHREYTVFCESLYDSEEADAAQTYGLTYNSKTGAFTTFTPAGGPDVPVVFCVAYARGYYLQRDVPQEPGITYALTVGDGPPLLLLQDNIPGSGYDVHAQDIAFRAAHEGDPTHIKKWVYIDWDLLGHEAAAALVSDALTAVYQDSEEGPELTQDVPAVTGNELRIVVPRSAARVTKLVNGLRGHGLTVYGCRLTYVSSGRNSPLTAAAPNG